MGSQWITTRESANRHSMLTQTHAKAKGLADLPPVVNDSLLALIALCDADPRPEKIDVGVGVFRDAVGNTPILKVMKEAEQRLVDTQVTKAYLGSAGDKRFAELIIFFSVLYHAVNGTRIIVQDFWPAAMRHQRQFALGERLAAQLKVREGVEHDASEIACGVSSGKIWPRKC